MGQAYGDRCHLAELVLAVALATDLGTGQPLDHILCTTLRALRIARASGVAP
jgi:hypothetical protein